MEAHNVRRSQAIHLLLDNWFPTVDPVNRIEPGGVQYNRRRDGKRSTMGVTLSVRVYKRLQSLWLFQRKSASLMVSEAIQYWAAGRDMERVS